jgi:hypothetical protein
MNMLIFRFTINQSNVAKRRQQREFGRRRIGHRQHQGQWHRRKCEDRIGSHRPERIDSEINDQASCIDGQERSPSFQRRVTNTFIFQFYGLKLLQVPCTVILHKAQFFHACKHVHFLHFFFKNLF